MSAPRLPAHHRVVLIRLRVEANDPISGEVAAAGAEPVPFRGWLELLGLLSRLVEECAEPPTAPG